MTLSNQLDLAFDEEGEVVEADFYDFTSGFDTERIIFLLTADQATVLALRYLGYTAPEVVKIMGLSKIKKYYKINHQLRKIIAREVAREGHE